MRASAFFITLVTALAVAGASVSAQDWAPREACFECHQDIWNRWVSSGHPYKLRTAEDAKTSGIPLPSGYTWDDISLVIGGRYKKSRYVDQNGFIITVTGTNRDVPGKNQYNLETGRWVDYNAGQKEKKYDCGSCHTTGYLKEGSQDSMRGVVGTWKYGGVTCENCHGPGGEHVAAGGDASKIVRNETAALCGRCHVRGEPGKIPAAGGFIQHHEQFNEQQSMKMQKLNCVSCHDPHASARVGIIAACADCHAEQQKSYAATSMAAVGVECKECHMPRMVKSAEAFGKYQGDIRTHLFTITLDPAATQFSDDGKWANPYVTVEFACLDCHRNKDRDWALRRARDVHK